MFRHGVTKRWRVRKLTLVVAVLALAGTASSLYPMTASWWSSYHQSQVIRLQEGLVRAAHPGPDEQLRSAHQYNEALSAGVDLSPGATVPEGTGVLGDASLQYESILSVAPHSVMARLKVPTAGVDLPVFHGTSDAVLLEGVGHLQGSHFPVGGGGTHAVLTAHRGLANATMFSNLNLVRVGDRFTIEVFGEVLTYEVRTTRVIDPSDTQSLRADPERDLVTLITCTPLGVNSHRIVVTGARVTPTPIEDVRAAGAVPSIPGFPWWSVWIAGVTSVVAGYVVLQGRSDAVQRVRRHGR